MKTNFAIVSLRFNPAFLQSLIAYAKAVTELGFNAQLFVAPEYTRFSELRCIADVLEVTDALPCETCSHVIFLNPAFANKRVAKTLKKGGCKILYLYHEPWHMSLDFIRNEGIVAAFKHAAAHRLTIPTLKLADTVVLASEFGLRQYDRSDIRYNRSRVCIPLLFDDELSEDLDLVVRRKRFFGYIGGLTRSHGFDRYLSFVRHVFREGINVRFMVASMYPFPTEVLDEPLIKENLHKLEIRCGRPLDTEAMNRCYAESFCIWNLYRRSTQSGVLPKAMMFGTPSIASQAGSYPEFIVDGVNGKFASGDDWASILRAVNHILADNQGYAKGCRERFRETFYYRAQLDRLSALL